MPPRIATVRKMASILAAQNTGSASLPYVSQYWVHKFLKRHNTLKLKHNRKYNYQRAKYKDPVLI